MNSNSRYHLMRTVLASLCEQPSGGDYVVFIDADRPDEYVQAAWSGRGLLGEVGSREWVDAVRPLSPDAVAGVATLGFTGGGAERNYVREALSTAPRRAASVLNRALEAAYGRRGVDVVVKTNVDRVRELAEANGWAASSPADVGQTRDALMAMVHTALEAHDWRIFRDECTGGYMTYWGWESNVGPGFHLWWNVEGQAPCEVLSVRVVGDRPVFDEERPQLLVWMNEWNFNHWWPTVSLPPTSEDSTTRITCSWSVPARGITSQQLVSDSVQAVTHAAMEFFRWLHEQRSEQGHKTSTAR